MDDTIAHTLLEDSRYKEGKKLILEALSAAKDRLSFNTPSRTQLQHTYESLIQSMNRMRGNPLYYPFLGSGLGHGLLVELADGSTKYDLIAGIGTHYFGHNFLELADAMIDAAVQDTVMQGNLEQNADSQELLSKLLKASGLDHALLTTSGAMANENALKIIFQKKQPRTRLFAFDGCFMGRTLVLSQITDKASFRTGLPDFVSVDYLPFYDERDHQGSIQRTLAAIQKSVKRYPQQHAAICIEPVQGENGFYAGHKEFFKEIGALCKKESIAVLVDEVQTFGRTPSLFAFHYFDMQDIADVVTIGKVSQVAATLWKDEFNPKPGLLSQTFTGSTSAIRAALFTLRYAEDKDLFGANGKIQTLHACFKRGLEDINKRLPGMCEGPYGIGCMIAFTICQGDSAKSAAFAQKLFENGVIGFVAGTMPVRIRFLIPPAVTSDSDIQNVCAIIEKTIRDFVIV